ncbi:MAG: rRNA maturation RNase YbeY [Thermodesulfobacteriota bacterium]
MSPSARRATVTVNVSAARGMAKHAPLLRRLARAALRHLGEDGSELSIALVGDDEMQRLNRDYRGKDRPTDVLAFAQREGEGLPGEAASGLLGDVVIALPTAERQASERGHGVERELAELLVHGVLHLLGYDHERSPAEARRMFAKARKVLAALGGADLPGPASSRGTSRRRGRGAAKSACRRSAR